MHPALKVYFETGNNYSPTEEALIASCFKPLTTQKNEILVPKGAVAQHMYFVLKGCLRIFMTDEFENESTRYLIFEGNMGTAFPSFILRQPSSAAIQSVEASELLALSYEDREMLMKKIPAWETAYRIIIEMAYIASIQRIESFITMDALSRYNQLLKKSPHIVQKLPSRIVADYLGISQETLSRLKSKK